MSNGFCNKRCKSLKSFELTGETETITSQAFQNFIQGLPYLENLKLGSISNIKNEGKDFLLPKKYTRD